VRVGRGSLVQHGFRGPSPDATLSAKVAGNRARVTLGFDGVNDPFLHSWTIHLLRIGGSWEISCLGYCNGQNP
jgi:hypothetical protein